MKDSLFRHPPERDPKTSTFQFLNTQPWQKGASIHPALVLLFHITASAHGFCIKCSPCEQTDHLWRFFQSCLFYHIISSAFTQQSSLRAITPSALCRIMISFPFLPNKNNVTGTAGIYRGRIPVSRHDIRVVSECGNTKGRRITKSYFLRLR